MKIKKNLLTFTESLQFVNGIIDGVFNQDDEGNDIEYSSASLHPLIQSTFVEMFSDYVFVEDFDENFAVYMSVDIDEYIKLKQVNKVQYYGMLKAIEDGISFRKQKLLNSQPKPVDEMYSALTTLLSTLNSKASEIDVTKFDKIIKKLNPQEILKEYQKSSIGNDIRDKTIQDLAKENKELKKQFGARNVKA